MKLSEIITPERIIPELKAKDKASVLEELAKVVCRGEPGVDKDALVKVLLERERLGSTGIGDGVAIPHGKLGGVTQPIISFGRSKTGLDFDSMDTQPVHLFFLLVAPENSAGAHLKVLAKIAKMLKNSGFRKKLMEAEGRQELYEVIVGSDDEL
ncbi:MAG: PTS sugar transporter subunit IIA [Deltaproteobacteria bacterium]|nr:PTS sugar transporter subunit IIA [Deltaproteobacteria bacterium]MBW1930429.1 PTS sugar transporter subunit IIA [Deltaproteobacteria bacterium]MBW2025360.1 PTS sugar transporter subunit IIA [Deltaproteobacteria bacterium]MBW2125361.1 PTS sugar transporter subunit IIA [Deltaproteobacteria bacterium]RLB19230.1 MAG: PTS sugar transporter subunit IIA [Deltaproteobacteria bacterium]